ncbi:MAG TPA: site-2 protease family protein [Symbiobacteriaceae bacterium]|nr:site-2 protease family protein [Symbiobacteriaceae bacterium]
MAFPDLQTVIMSIPGVLMGFTFHEFGHAYVATLFGDDTPRLQGRVTLSPLAHLDPIGTILLLIGGFGWAKPVQINTARLRPRVWGDIAVSMAGVAMNFLLALVFYAAALIMFRMGIYGGYDNPVLVDTLYRTAQINVFLIAFNVLPLPPLDGFHVARYLFPRGMEHVVATLYRYGPIILIFLFFTPVAASILRPVNGAVWSGVTAIVHALVGRPI